MTQKKLEIIGPYTPEHEGPFCTRDGVPVRLLTRTEGTEEYPIVGYVGGDSEPVVWDEYGYYFDLDQPDENDIMNAREVPVAREFWLNEFKRGDGHIGVSHAHDTELQAINERHERANWNWTRTIHVREVLPGDGA